MATGTLTGSTIAATYKSLLKVKGGANTILDGDIQIIEDGDGVDSVLGLATDSALISGDGNKLYFYDADGDEHISADNAGVLSIAAGAEIDLTATAVDLNGTLDVSGTLTQGGASQFNSTLTVGVDGTGYDVIFYGDTASGNMTWDESEDDLVLNDARLFVDQDVVDVDSIVVDTEATSAHGLTIAGDALTTGSAAVFSTSCVNLASTASGGLVEISSTGDTDTNANNLLFIKNDHTDSTGTTALKIQQDSTGASIDAGGYIVNEQGRQDHVANTMPAPYYRFDGVDDYIVIGDNINLQPEHITMSLWVRFNEDPATTAYFFILHKEQTGAGADTGYILITDEDRFRTEMRIGGSNKNAYTTDGTLVKDKWYHVAVTFDESNLKIYQNGVLHDTTAASGTLDTTNGENLYIGRNTNNTSYAAIEISDVKIFNNALTATEVKELYSGASVPFKYKGANQTDMVTNGGFDSDSGWTKSAPWTIADGVASYDDASTNPIYQAIPITNGKRYRVTLTISNSSSLACFAIKTDNLYMTIISSSPSLAHFVNTGDGTYVVDVQAAEDSTYFKLHGHDSGGTFDVDDISMVPIGAVAEWDGSGVGASRWDDKSGNELHGTVSGATVENAPADADSGLTYEEGTWDAVVTDGTNPMTMLGTHDTGYYTKVGNLVTVSGLFVTTSLGSASGAIRITGLPFTIANNEAAHAGGGAAYGTNFAITAGHSVTFFGGTNSTAIHLQVWDATTGVSYMQASEWTLDGQIMIGFSYRAA